MSDKSSDLEEDWAIVDKDGELEVSDDGSSSSCSLEVVNLDTEVVAFTNRRSSERSVSPTLGDNESKKSEPTIESGENSNTAKTSLPESLDHPDSLCSDDRLSEADAAAIMADIAHVSSMGPVIEEGLLDGSTGSSMSSIAQLKDEEESSTSSRSSFTALKPDSDDEKGIQELSSLISSSNNPTSNVEEQQTGEVVMEAVVGLSGLSEKNISDVSDNNSDTDSDFIRLEVSESLDVDNLSSDQSAMTSSSVSSRFSFMSRENSPPEPDHVDDVEVPDIPVEQPAPDNQDGDIHGNEDHQHEEEEDQEDDDHDDDHHGDIPAEIEEIQDASTESEIDDEENARIESDQSDVSSIPALDDDMSFVNDIGDLPLVAGDVARQYVHNPNRHLNLKLDIFAILMFTIVVGLGIGHYIATFDEIDAYDSIHNSMKNMISQCEGQRFEQTRTLNNLNKEYDLLMQKFHQSRRDLERLRLQNAALYKEIDSKNTDKEKAEEKETLRLYLKKQINQLETENQELKQAIGRLKYMIHPANDISETSQPQFVKKESCDRSVVKVPVEKESHTSDFSLDDLESMHDAAALDNLLLKQEIGKLRYTKHPGNREHVEDESDQPIPGDKECMKSDSCDPLESILDVADKTDQPVNHENEGPADLRLDDLWVQNKDLIKVRNELEEKKIELQQFQEKYETLESQTVINSTNCLTYLLTNLSMADIISQLDSDMLDKFLNVSFFIANDVKGSVTDFTTIILEEMTKSGEDFFDSISEVKKTFEKTAETGDGLGEKEMNQSETENSNNTEERNSKSAPNVKWSENIKEIMNKTRNKMTNVSQQIKDTWLQVKNLSVKFLTQHEPAVSNTLNKITDRVVNFGQKIKNKIQRKVKRWYRMSKKQPNPSRSPSKKYVKENVRKTEKQKREEQYTKTPSEKNHKNSTKKDKKQQKKNNERLRKDERQRIKILQKQQKEFAKAKNKSLKKFKKFQNKILKINEKHFKKMNSDSKSSLLGYVRETSRLLIGLELDGDVTLWFDCQMLFWSNQVDMETLKKESIVQCEDRLQSWQTEMLEDKIVEQDGLGMEADIPESKESFHGNNGNHGDVKDNDHTEQDLHEVNDDGDDNGEDDWYEKLETYPEPRPDWLFKRAHNREDIRKQESQPDWIFDRANHRKDIRQHESEPDWVFDRAHHREDIRQHESEPDWVFDRAHHRENLRQQETEPDWIFNQAHHRKNRRDHHRESDWMFDQANNRKEKREYRQRHPATFRPNTRSDHFFDGEVDFDLF
ncbi:uncharacterized protein LOC126818582 isoform X2 [Patella vulgata]|uniref:uncharacterized protein LOC126818582 isoform X2 n=1 Tax=Patella vulgata TaxID=6465 RepID=UPI00217F3AC3|nr:uncharacterized protein LOC126818582 isoform X2 [Patella vulgata]